MGWETVTADSILDSSQIDFTEAFFQEWIYNAGSRDFEVELSTAIKLANIRKPVKKLPRVFGATDLKWKD
ncbi:hypothetical protein Cflav_PD4003 [Pedosphaera parvula Ellin514]|uniref:Uncharacterized protein n=1 Tax=Pedosphaera parvula (strain Ellin514) TaxID=320771 RepID=B9XGR3_PEDPL|nr:hypothetical protein Cflav_PD4003 [Pedosphaera parvula Ellin514]